MIYSSYANGEREFNLLPPKYSCRGSIIVVIQILLIAFGVLGIAADLIALFSTQPNFGTIVQAVVGITLLMWGLLYQNVSESPIRWLLAFLCIVPAGIAAAMWATALIKRRTARSSINSNRVDAVIVLG